MLWGIGAFGDFTLIGFTQGLIIAYKLFVACIEARATIILTNTIKKSREGIFVELRKRFGLVLEVAIGNICDENHTKQHIKRKKDSNQSRRQGCLWGWKNLK